MAIQWRNSAARWGAVHQTLHWLVALGILYAALLAIYIVNQEHGVPENVQRYLYWIKVHKSVGLTVLALVVFRIAWLWSQPHPAVPGTMTPTEIRLARLTHRSFYALMLCMPVTGFLSSNSVGAKTTFWGLLEVPAIFPAKKLLIDTFNWLGVPMPGFIDADARWAMVLHTTHWVVGYAFLALIALHVLAALWHHFKLRDDVLRRMLPGYRA